MGVQKTTFVIIYMLKPDPRKEDLVVSYHIYATIAAPNWKAMFIS